MNRKKKNTTPVDTLSAGSVLSGAILNTMGALQSVKKKKKEKIFFFFLYVLPCSTVCHEQDFGKSRLFFCLD